NLMNMNWKNIYRGFFMGMSDIVAGVSGGTVAVLVGIYDRLIASINGLFSKEWKRHLGFLIPLGIGVGLALFSVIHLIEWLVDTYTVSILYTLIGIIIGMLIFLFHESGTKNNFRLIHYILLVLGIIILVLLPEAQGEGKAIVERTIDVYITLFFAGF